MPNPIMKKIDINKVLKRAVEFIKLSSKNEIQVKSKNNHNFISGDEDQLYRVFINLIKNSEESFEEKKVKNSQF